MRSLTSILLTALFLSTPALAMHSERFVDNGDGTVTDTASDLVWKKCSEGQSFKSSTGECDGLAGSFTWQQAVQTTRSGNTDCEGENPDVSDWRLPDIKELSGLVDRSRLDPAIDIDVFPETQADWYWSSTPYAGPADYAWVVHFNGGNANIIYVDSALRVRLVRSSW
jgi:hypothetical protein